jgi:MoxR-like ATPase
MGKQMDMADAGGIDEKLSHASAALAAVRGAVNSIIIGQQEAVNQTLIAILSGGHALLTGVPGLGKTLLVETLGITLGLATTRIQFTPDLMPSDILGSEVLDETPGGRRFRFIPGPIFTELLMADEINRASPRTQSALLQAMAEGHVAIAGVNHPVRTPFHVLATQNPLEQEGTYPLPEAQLDRFLLDIRIGYPAEADERAMLLATTGIAQASAQPMLTAQSVRGVQSIVRAMPIGAGVVTAILALVRGARPESAAWPELPQELAWGPGPRAAQALMLAVRARALLDQRLAPSIDDVAALAAPALRHRMSLSFAARTDGLTLDSIINRLVTRL